MKIMNIKKYLNGKGIEFKEANGELITDCVFCGKKKHLYFSAETGQYDCKVCGEQGNLITLARHLGDSVKDVAIHNHPIDEPKKISVKKKEPVDEAIMEACHLNLPDRLRSYLNSRGINDDLIVRYKIGYGEFYGRHWLTIPIRDKEGKFIFFKLRKDPDDDNNDTKYKFYPIGSEAALYGLDEIQGEQELIVITEGEFDRLLLVSSGVPAITSTAGAGTFKDDWLDDLEEITNIYICFDRDEAGDKGSEKLIKMIGDKFPDKNIYRIALPEMENGKDITDFLVKNQGNVDDLIYKLAVKVAGRDPIDASKFVTIGSDELIDVLGITIKQDDVNKLITFLCQLTAYTDNSQFNISYNAPSSTGKSYIPIEISALFPAIDIIKLGNCSPTAFLHEQGKNDKKTNTIIVDLSRKIIIFLDQPHNETLARLRSLLSHDEKIISSKITDKNQGGGNRTKTVNIIGFPSVIFCSAGLKIDEQEATRFFLLSPQMTQEKIRESIYAKSEKESDREGYYAKINSLPKRQLLIERIQAIKEAEIDEIRINDPEKVRKMFFEGIVNLKPRHTRDMGRLIALIKAFALLNLWFRERTGNTIVANDDDITEATKVWRQITESQEYNLPPYVLNLYKDIIIPAFREKNQHNDIKIGLFKAEIAKTHLQVYKRIIEDYKLRQIITVLEASGLIGLEKDPSDKRKITVTPLIFFDT
jgi:hypothetical protein